MLPLVAAFAIDIYYYFSLDAMMLMPLDAAAAFRRHRRCFINLFCLSPLLYFHAAISRHDACLIRRWLILLLSGRRLR